MTKIVLNIVGLLMLAGVVVSFTAHDERKPFIVSTQWLGEHLNDPDVVLLHIGEKGQFDSLHIPGALFISRDNISTPRSSALTLELPSVAHLDSVFESYGISNNSHIVLYFGRDWVSPTARVYLTLDYLGLADRTSILDGGMPAWQSEGGKVTSEIRKAQVGQIIPHVNPQVIADAKYVENHLKDEAVVVVDSRIPNFYEGKEEGVGNRSGHIPGAKSMPFEVLVDDSNRFKSADSLRQIFERAGVKPGEEVVTYCHIGQQASLGYFVARYLGYDAKLYDGSFEDWAKSGRPVEAVSR